MNFAWHLRVALRAARKRPGLFLTAILIVGGAVGVNTALFSLLDAVLLRPIPGVERSGELLRIRRTANGRTQGNQSYPDFVDIRSQARTLSGLAAERLIPVRLAGPPAEILPAAIVSANYFQVMGVRAALGRALEPEDDRGPHAVAVLSHAEWQRRFGGDPAVLGRAMTLNGTPYTIVGVAAEPFRGIEFGENTALWVPLSMASQAMTRPTGYPWLAARRAGWLTYYGRRRPGARMAAVHAELAAIGKGLESAYPDSNAGRGFVADEGATMTPPQREQLRLLFGLLSAAALLVLLIACGNIGNLLLARAAAQSREFALRTALGARRRDLLRQPLAEAALIGAPGGLLGFALAPWILPLLRMAVPAAPGDIALDHRVLAFGLATTILAVVVFALAPAWFSTGTSLRGGRVMRGWVVAQVALSLALVVNGSLVLGSMRNILAIDPGYRAGSVLVTSMDLSLASFTPERGTQFFRELIGGVEQLPGVRSATIAKSSPAVDWSDRIEIAGGPTADQNLVAPGYFRTLGIPLLAGRDFLPSDRADVVIVSKRLADTVWPAGNALGQRLRAGTRSLEVVGVASDTRYRTVLAAPPPLVYMPALQNYDSIGRLLVWVDGDPDALKEPLRRLVQQANPELPVRGVVSLQEQIDASLWQRRAASTLLSLFGALAIALACAGIYGVVSYATAQQTRDIAIRMAIGAERSDVVRQALARTMRLSAAGIGLGIPLAAWAKPALAGMLYGVGGFEWMAFAGTALLFLLVAAAAAAVPARRAATIDPALALRAE